VQRVRDTLVRNRLDRVVDIHNPMDLTPMAGDTAFSDVVDAIVGDENTDALVVGTVPFTVAMQTLPPGPGHDEDLAWEGSFVSRIGRARKATAKPVVAVIDAGPLYDPLAQALLERGIPAFRSADRALHLLNLFCASRQKT
jgi:acyl-CoA synthetase (NDP forming)